MCARREKAKQGFTWLSGKVLGSTTNSQAPSVQSSQLYGSGAEPYPMPTSMPAQYNAAPAQDVVMGYPHAPPPYDAAYSQENAVVAQPHVPVSTQVCVLACA